MTVVLVEGESDRAAVDALARRRGRNLLAEGVSLIAIGGSKNFPRFLERFGPRGSNRRVLGLYDAGEDDDVRRGLERAGFGSGHPEELGFFVCVADLEDELIRALGAEAVVQLLEAEGELEAFRTLQRQPQWRGRAVEEQLRRFIGTFSGRKIRLAPLLVRALELDRVPEPLDRLLSSI